MGTAADALLAMQTAKGRVPAVIRRLMRLCDVRAADLAPVLDVSRAAVSARLTGATVIKQEELAALSVFFGVPVEVFYLSPEDAIRWVIEHSPDLLLRGKG